ncbi:hypothetical protein RchiOBHm_Chr2g0154831 [Rosa chinensis]|uniref:Uncharacterized protein n=1 Tax=Rosa chinensis TaxID=74649 RepID=A0A2P6S129_ROSCH|nr:hypothetical protein RchiOBHm_Chr2g0154831 [Rosa chinensis]
MPVTVALEADRCRKNFSIMKISGIAETRENGAKFEQIGVSDKRMKKSTRVNRSQHHQGSGIKPSLIMCGSALRKKRRKKKNGEKKER